MASNESTDRIVVGIDFGTTFSGVAAVYSATAEAPDEIHVIKTWPGGNNATSDKVPSEIAYGPPPSSRAANGTRNTRSSQPIDPWNFGALNTSLNGVGASSEGVQPSKARWGFQLRGEEERIRCMKLLLDGRQELPKYVSHRELKGQLRRTGKTAENVVADYLTELWKHAYETLERRYGKFFIANTKVDVVLTVPAVWSDAAKDATLNAARTAGMGENLALISEPEAAAVYTLKSIQPNHLRVGDNFIVCDAGGGTVELISYEIQQTTPLRIQESVEGTGACCGAAILNMRFESHVRSVVGAAIFDRIREQKPRSWQTALKYFEDYVKRNFNPDDFDAEFNVPFPGVDGEAPGVEEGFLTISYVDVRVIFAPVLEEITQLVQGQVDQLLSRGKSVNGIVLVGGFGQSNCLFKCLENRFKDLAPPPPYPGSTAQGGQVQRPFEVMQPVNAWTAVVRGAVLRGLEGVELVLNRRSRRHYGVISRCSFNEDIHPASCKVWDHNEEVWKAGSRMTWYITKGENCSSTAPILLPFYRTFDNNHDRKTATVDLVACDEEDAPDGYESGRHSTTRKICTLTVDLTSVPARFWKHRTNPSGVRYQHLSYQLGMQIQSGGIRFDLRIDGVTYGDVVTSFN